MPDNVVKLDAMSSTVGANPTRYSAVLGARVDSLQQQHAGLDQAYQTYILGGNDINDYFSDGQSLTQQTMVAMVAESYNRIDASEQINEMKAGTDAYKSMTELAKG